MAPTILYIGMGNMGRGMVKNLVAKGQLTSPIQLYNRTTSRAEAFASTLPAGSVVVAPTISAGLSAGAEIVFLCLAEDSAVLATISDVVSAGSSLAGRVVVDCSTVSPATSRAVAAAVRGAGAGFVAMPVFGAPAAADAGMLVCCPCGRAADVERVRPLLVGVVGRAVIDLTFKEDGDEDYGRGAQLKLIGNTFIFNMVTQLAEGFVAAERTGLGTAPVLGLVDLVFAGSNPAHPYAAYARRMLEGDYWRRDEPLFGVDLARKDIRLAREVAAEAPGRDEDKPRLRNAEVADAYLVDVKEHAGSKGDVAAIYGAARKRAGLEFEIGKEK